MNSIIAAVVVNSAGDGHKVTTFFNDESVEDLVLHLREVYGVMGDVDVVLLEAGSGDYYGNLRLVHVGKEHDKPECKNGD